LDRLHEVDAERLRYDHAKPGPGGNSPLLLTPLELLDRPPLWAVADAEHDPSADPALPPTPAFEFDQRVTW
jgi:hypothetical protein